MLYRLGLFSLIAVASVGVVTDVLAQTSEMPLEERLNRLERRLVAIESKIFSGGASGVTSDRGLDAADVEVRLNQIERESGQLYGGVEELGHAVQKLAEKLELITQDQDMRLQDVEQKIETGVAAKGSGDGAVDTMMGNDVPLEYSADQIYQQAYNFLTTASHDKARTWFETFLARHPQHARAENSHYWLGEIHLVRKQPEKAIIAFSNGIKAFPEGNKVPANLLKMGVAFERLEQFDHAKTTWKKLVDEFPDSNEAQKAEKHLEELG